ncbi:MAG: SDR family NAD(P)-dependent oxidoreductase [Pseudomonadota bacterium]
MELNNTISAIVTGGASGLGAGCARALSAKGVKVALFDVNEEKGTALAQELGATFHRCDIADEASVDAALKAARDVQGQERVLVNCAGVVVGKRVARRDRNTGAIDPHDMATFAKVVGINLVGTFTMIAKSAAGMMDLDPVGADNERGVMVTTSSVAAQDGQIGQVAYAASKGGVQAITLPIARDLAKDGIRICSILPGLFSTPMFDGLPQDAKDALAASVPFPSRLGTAAEFASLALYICENPMLNGESIRLDGALRLAPR